VPPPTVRTPEGGAWASTDWRWFNRFSALLGARLRPDELAAGMRAGVLAEAGDPARYGGPAGRVVPGRGRNALEPGYPGIDVRVTERAGDGDAVAAVGDVVPVPSRHQVDRRQRIAPAVGERDPFPTASDNF
jgi:hypothetical protein